MKAYLQKNGIRVGIILAAAALIIGLGSAARDGRIGVIQNVPCFMHRIGTLVVAFTYFSLSYMYLPPCTFAAFLTNVSPSLLNVSPRFMFAHFGQPFPLT